MDKCRELLGGSSEVGVRPQSELKPAKYVTKDDAHMNVCYAIQT